MKTEQPKQEKDYTALLQPVGTKQETLEEVAKNYLKGWGEYDDKKAFIAGAKWQQEQDKNKFSEAIIDILDNVIYWETCPDEYKVIIEKFIEQFKNK